MFKNDIEKALRVEDSIKALRDFVIGLNFKGLNKDEIYSIFYDCSLEFIEEGRESEAELLEVVMDMITGWYLGENLNL
jgi:hypothetical protein